jgi:serine protease
MNQPEQFRSVRQAAILLALALLLLFTAQWSGQVAAAPETPDAPDAALTFVNVNDAAVNCLFDNDCDIFADDTTALFTFDGLGGAGFLQSRLWPRGELGTAGGGLFPYLYRIDMTELIGPGNPACISQFSLDFGPVVPIDYNGDNSPEHGFVVTSGGLGSIAPSSVTQTGTRLTFAFQTPICGDFSPSMDNGVSSFFFGLASPFPSQEVTAELVSNWIVDPLALTVRAPEFRTEPSLAVFPSGGLAGETAHLIGSGYTPGGYPGTIRWNGADVEVMSIPNGGAFLQPFTIPATAAIGDHTITVCSLNPCATGEFEQLASAPYAVYGRSPATLPYTTFLPLVESGGLSATEPFSYVVDPNVAPFQSELPGLDGGAPRPLAAVRDPRGQVSTFVANELVVQTDDDAALAALLARTGGEIVLEIDPTDAGISDLPALYLVRANLNQADLSSFVANINALMDPEIQSAGRLAFSSGDGPRIFALAAAETAGGLTVGVNWVSEPETIPVNSLEAPNGPGPYEANAYRWLHFARGTEQDIGVPEAWTLLHRAGRLGNRVDLAVLDGGFFPNGDFPAGITYVSVVPFVIDPRNVDGVDGRSPFHGTDVLQTAVARSDNNFGVVGVAAPVARSIAVYTTYDQFVSVAAVLAARAAGADIINMSYRAAVPAIVSWTVLPFEATTVALRASGTLLFASAGNDGQDVDGRDCFLGICWEHTWHAPCENNGVICVGGLGWDSKRRAGNSNFGSRGGVHIFAPYTVYRGQSPSWPGAGATVDFVNGTSFSSPYAASVAALIWAANPSLSANQVWQTMRDTAHSSPDGRVPRYVNAHQAVLNTIGVGIDATLNSPVQGNTYLQGVPIPLDATVGYVATGSGTPVQVQWRLNGSLLSSVTYTPGSGSHTLYPTSRTPGLSAGSHTVSIRVTAGTAVVERSATFTWKMCRPPPPSPSQPAALRSASGRPSSSGAREPTPTSRAACQTAPSPGAPTSMATWAPGPLGRSAP